MSNIKIIDGKEHWDLTSEEIVVEAPIDGASIRWHFRPYAVGAAKMLLRSVANKFKMLTSGVTESTSGDPSAYVAFFDAHFLRMSNVAGQDGKDLSLDDQLAWLAENPQVKGEVVAMLKPMPIEIPDNELTGKAVLMIRPSVESTHHVKCWNDGSTMELTIKHRMNKILAKDRMDFARSVSRNQMDHRHNTFQVMTNYDVLESLYDRLSVAVDGACIGEIPCGESNRIEWIKKIPFWWKVFAIENVFSQDQIKNA